MNVSILGTEWQVIMAEEKDCPILKDCDGCADPSIKTIYINDDITRRDGPDENKDKIVYMDTIIRHEIIHAFLHESGVWANSSSSEHWAMNEEMIDWFALQLPKIVKACNQIGVSV